MIALAATVLFRKRDEAVAEAFSWAAWVMIETLHRRSTLRSSLPGITTIRGALRHEIEAHGFPKTGLELFEQHCRRLNAGGPTSHADGELDRLVQRIRGLRAKTVEQGCTEQEALAAAEKVAELLDRHGLSLSDVDYRRQTCDSLTVNTGRRRHGAIESCVTTVAKFFDCRTWFETGPDGTISFTLFGLAGDVQAAHYLYDMIVAVFETEGQAFVDSAFYQGLPGRRRRSATVSFQHGLASGLIEKLTTIKSRRDSARTASGRIVKVGFSAPPMRLAMRDH